MMNRCCYFRLTLIIIFSASGFFLRSDAFSENQSPAASKIPLAKENRAFSAEEQKELQTFLQEMQHFSAATNSYKATLNGVVRDTYMKKRKGMMNSYDQKMRTEEAEERI